MKDKRLAMTDTLWDITRSPTHYLFCWYSTQQGTASPSSLARKWNTSATDQKNWNQTIKQEQWLHLGYFYLMNWRIKSSRPMRKMKHSDSIQRLCKRGDDAVPLVKVTNNIIFIIISIVLKINTNFGCRQLIHTMNQSSTYIFIGLGHMSGY